VSRALDERDVARLGLQHTTLERVTKMNLSDELDRLNELRQQGALSEQEFEAAKAKVLSGNSSSMPDALEAGKLWTMLIHLTQLCGYLVPLAGWIVPIVIWQMQKDKIPECDAHGRAVANWLISLLIYLVVAFLLSFIIIGIPILLVLGILGVVFPVIGAIKACNGEPWEYPMAIRFV
jgi:uncharacterized Tic20 family protein